MDVKSRLIAKNFPTSSKFYKTAHEKADKKEKTKYPKGYEEMKKVDRKVMKKDKKELAGKNLKSGKIEVNKIVPKKLRKEVAYHEKIENREIKKLEKAESGKHTAKKIKSERKATHKLSKMHKGY